MYFDNLEDEVEHWILEVLGESREDSPELYTNYLNAVKCFRQHDKLGELSIPQILNKFVGVWDSRDAYIEEVLEEYGIEDKLQEIKLPGDIRMSLSCLDYDELWKAMSQLNTALRGYTYISIDYYPPEADHRFYVYDMKTILLLV